MTIGISKEMLPRLMDKISDLCDNEDNIDYYIIEKLLISECTELNPWLPIEQAPKDRQILFFYPEFSQVTGQWSEEENTWILALTFYLETEPTHYQELPEPPKCNT